VNCVWPQVPWLIITKYWCNKGKGNFTVHTNESQSQRQTFANTVKQTQTNRQTSADKFRLSCAICCERSKPNRSMKVLNCWSETGESGSFHTHWSIYIDTCSCLKINQRWGCVRFEYPFYNWPIRLSILINKVSHLKP